MCTYYEEMTGLTHRLDCECELISPEDIALSAYLLDEILELVERGTYELFIASDMLTDSGEIQS